MKTLFDRLRAWFQTPAKAATVTLPAPDAITVDGWIAAIRAANLSYCGPPKLENIAAAVQQVRAAHVPGRYVEAGVALGGSAILLGLMKPNDVPLDLYDVFAMIPPPGPDDGEDAHRRYAEIRSGDSKGLGGDTYYGYRDGLRDQVLANLRRFGLAADAHAIRAIAGLFEATLHPEGPIALAHVDCDWYDSVRVCIERIGPRLAPGGIVIFDDYSSYSGCRRAVDEWRAKDPTLEVVFERRSLGLRRAAARVG